MSKKPQQKKLDPKILERQYISLAPTLESFCKELLGQLAKLLEDAGVILGFPIQTRVKEWQSVAEKLERGSLNVSALGDVQDLVGLRIILLFRRDISKVSELIDTNFKVIRKYDTQERLKDDQFGYASMHFVVELPEKWLRVPTLAKMGGLRAEIQVRTLSQHIWAEVSHTLQYKQEESVPPSLRRAIYRASALLETVDLEFERILKERESYRTAVDLSGTRERLNVDLLEKTLDSLLPRKNKAASEDYSELLRDLNHFHIETQNDLTNLVQKHLNTVSLIDAKRAKVELDNLVKKGEVTGTTPERVRRGVFFTHVGLVRMILEQEFGQRLNDYLLAKHF